MEQNKSRPTLILILCVVGIVWSLISFVFVFSPFIKKIGNWAPAIFGVVVTIRFISFIGVLHMKRWGVFMFLTALFLNLIFSIMVDDVGYVSIGLFLCFGVILLIFYNKMSEGL